MLMEMYTKENGSMIRPKGVVLMSIWMAQSMLETGKKIDKMDTVLKLGQIMQNMKEIMNLVKNMELVPLNGQMVLHI